MRVEFFSCVKVLAYCCMSNHIHVFIFLEFGMFGSGKGKKAEREKEFHGDGPRVRREGRTVVIQTV